MYILNGRNELAYILVYSYSFAAWLPERVAFFYLFSIKRTLLAQDAQANYMKVIISDMHLDSEEAQHYSYKLAKKFIQSIQPEELIIAGDFLDFAYLSKYVEGYEKLKENKRLIKDFSLFTKELDFFQTYCKKVILIEGNHEQRITRFEEQMPSVADGLISLEYNLHLKDRKIDFYSIDKPYFIFPDLVAIHGTRYGMNYTKDVLNDNMISTIQGHSHRTQSFHRSFPLIGKTIHSFGLGCLCNINPGYLHGKQSGWSNSFGVIEGNEKLWNFYNIDLSKNGFIFEKHIYK